MFGDAIGPVDDADSRLTRKPEPSDEADESRIDEEYTDRRLGPKLCRFTRLEAQRVRSTIMEASVLGQHPALRKEADQYLLSLARTKLAERQADIGIFRQSSKGQTSP